MIKSIHFSKFIWLSLLLSFSIATAPALALEDKSAPDKADARQLISMDFNNVDIHVFIKFISELTSQNFVVDPGIKGNVTIISPSKISVAEAYKVFESVLEVQGYTTVKSGKILKIIPSGDARTKNIETMLKAEAKSPKDKIVTQIIPLEYADAAQIKRLFAPLISKNSVVLDYPPTNTLIITDVHSNITRLQKILKTIDVSGIGQELSIIPLEHASAAKFTQLLDNIFKKAPKAQKDASLETIRLVADERTNTLIVLASKDETLRIKNLVDMLDKEVARSDEKIHVYYLDNATAEELAEVLQSLSQKPAATAEKGKQLSPVVSENVKVTADKATNSLIIMADKDDYEILEDIIKKLDIARPMVYIEALIMEVNTDKEFKLGTEWVVGGTSVYEGVSAGYGSGFSGVDDYRNIGGLLPSAGGVAAFPSGFSLSILGEAIKIGDILFPSIGAVIQAFERDKDVHILAKPQIMTAEHEEAEIHIGKNIPYQTKAGVAGVNEAYNSYEYKDIGITLKVTPQINNNRMLQLKIHQKTEQLDTLVQTDSANDRPTTLKRTVDTTVIVKDGHTIAIGGLIDDSFSASEFKVPCIGDIPLFGWLFKTQSKSREKTNLFFFLTPHVIENPGEADQIYEKKRKIIDTIRERQSLGYPNPAEKIKPQPESDFYVH
jgi:general secretion pathway protein D